MARGTFNANAVPLIAGSGNVAAASAVATLTGTASTTVYIAGFEVTGSGATAGLPVTVTVAGLLGGTRHYTYTSKPVFWSVISRLSLNITRHCRLRR